jgi:glucan-binding YG repeat protein
MARYGKKAAEKVKKVMEERKKGTLKSGRSGKTVRSREQAIAIGLSEARRAGGKVPAKKKASAKKASARKSAARKPARKTTSRKPTARKSAKTSPAKKAGRKSASASKATKSRGRTKAPRAVRR